MPAPRRATLALMATSVVAMGAVAFTQLKTHEGLEYKTYLDPVGIPTVCYGHTGPDVRMGQTWSAKRCEEILLSDVLKHRAGLAKCVHTPLTQNQADAVVSFAFNVGVSRACSSTLVRKINANDLDGAAREFGRWKYARVGGKNVVLRGLVTRRQHETALFRSTAPAAPLTVTMKYLESGVDNSTS